MLSVMIHRFASLFASSMTIFVIMGWYYGTIYNALPWFLYISLPFLFVGLPLLGIVLGIMDIFKKEAFWGMCGIILGLAMLFGLWSLSSIAYIS